VLARKNALKPNRFSRQQAFQERARLHQERSLAFKREDFEEANMLGEKLKALDEMIANETPADAKPKEEDVNDIFAKINERNRQRNLEAIRKAEAEQAIRKRLERKALASGSGTLTPVDPSARVRTIPKLFKDRPRCVHFFL
jgi:RNA polymerase-associated protein RTF1